MNINATLLGQMITFALFVWFTMKYVWPPVTNALSERQKKISDGLAAALRGQHELERAEQKVAAQMQEVRQKIGDMMERAEKQAAVCVDEAKKQAQEERARILKAAELEVEQLKLEMRDGLRKEAVGLAMLAAQKVLSLQIDADLQRSLIEQAIEEI